MKLHQLNTHAERFLKDNFGLRLNIPIKRNGRLTRAAGRFVYNRVHGALRIEISGHVLDYSDKETILAILEHELVHYALYELGVPHQDGSPHFESKLKELNIPSQSISVKVPYQVYTCNHCGSTTAQPKKVRKGYGLECKACKDWMTHVGRYVIESEDVRKMASFDIEERNEYLSKVERV